MSKGTITINVSCAGSLQEYLQQFNEEQATVTVLDVYADAWGPCNALVPTYRDILSMDLDVSSAIVRFLQVNATLVLRSLQEMGNADDPHIASEIPRVDQQNSATVDKEDERSPNLEQTYPAFWGPILEEQEGRSKPGFMIYHDCKLADRFEGCRTPHLRTVLYRLCRCGRKPEFYLLRRNPRFLEQWMAELGDSPEIPLERFLQALRVWCLIPPSAPDFRVEELQSVSSVLMTAPPHDRYGIVAAPPDVRRGSDTVISELLRRRVHVRHCANWLAGINVVDAFQALLPEYHERLAEIVKQAESERNRAMQPEQASPDVSHSSPDREDVFMLRGQEKRLTLREVDSPLVTNQDEEEAVLAALGAQRQSLRTTAAGLPLPEEVLATQAENLP